MILRGVSTWLEAWWDHSGSCVSSAGPKSFLRRQSVSMFSALAQPPQFAGWVGPESLALHRLVVPSGGPPGLAQE